jgi:hypothetical protein
MLAAGASTSVVAQQRPADRSGPVMVSGIVFDSIAQRPLAGVAVQFVSTDSVTSGRVVSATADDFGRYTVPALQPGRYIAGFFHPAFDTLGLDVAPRPVEIRSGPQRVDLGTPSQQTVVTTICSADAVSDSTGMLFGHVRASDTRAPIAGASVAVEWTETVIDALGVRDRAPRVVARTVGPGWFAICGLPIEAALYAQAAQGADSTGSVEFELPSNGFRHITFYVGGGRRVPRRVSGSDSAVAGADPSRSMVWTGDARLTGTVVDGEGRPVPGGSVLVWGSGRAVTTNDRGAFVLDSLPGGTQTVEARLIGYVPVRNVVHLSAGHPATLELVIGEKLAVMAPVTVRAELVYSRQLVDFERRRRSGFGQYMTPAEIERRPLTDLAALLQGRFGVRVERDGGIPRVAMRARGRDCAPSLYVDGVMDRSGDWGFLKSDMIAAIEIYEREAGRPMEFADRNPCGAVAVWTRPFQPRVKRR